MENHPDAKLLRIFIGESDSLGHLPLYEAIIHEAKKQKLSGATVLRGVMGFGANTHIHRLKLLELSSDLPIVIEIVDKSSRITEFLEKVKSMFEEANCGGLITLEKAEVLFYKPKK
jgi:PII-like signaling protein